MFEEIARDMQSDTVAAMLAIDSKASGETIASLRYEVTPNSITLYGSGVIFTLVNGSKPWANRKTVPKWFVEVIKRWLAQKRLSHSPYLVARKIVRDGNARHRRTRARLILQPIAQRAAEKMAKQAAQSYLSQIKNIFHA